MNPSDHRNKTFPPLKLLFRGIRHSSSKVTSIYSIIRFHLLIYKLSRMSESMRDRRQDNWESQLNMNGVSFGNVENTMKQEIGNGYTAMWLYGKKKLHFKWVSQQYLNCILHYFLKPTLKFEKFHKNKIDFSWRSSALGYHQLQQSPPQLELEVKTILDLTSATARGGLMGLEQCLAHA